MSSVKREIIQRLGKNLTGYFGESINLPEVLRDCSVAGARFGWAEEILDAIPKPGIPVLSRPASSNLKPKKRIYISAGIHGDEPAGPLAALELLKANAWGDHWDVTVLPCLNPTGFALNRRENDEGIDLNRQYLRPTAKETLAHTKWLERQAAFDLCLVLHEDWEAAGFYVYELNPEGKLSLAEAMIQAVEKIAPIERSEVIEGRPAKNGIVRPILDPHSRPLWPESFYLLMHKTRLAYTLEASSDFPLALRTSVLVAAVNAALYHYL
jgi:hypothetical protein